VDEAYYYVVTVNVQGYQDTSGFLLSTGATATMNFQLALNTPAGPYRSVSPPRADGTQPVNVQFYNVTTAGKTMLTENSNSVPMPVGYVAGQPSHTFNLTSTATFTVGATACFNWGTDRFQDVFAVRVLHLEGGVWKDATSRIEPRAQSVCATVESLGSFALAETARSAIPQLSCAVEPLLQSLSSSALTDVNFTNGLSQSVSVYWRDYSGVRRYWFTLGPGASYLQGTYPTHPWVFTDTAGQCKGIFVTLPISPQTATLQ
jgi:hypothetical protein